MDRNRKYDIIELTYHIVNLIKLLDMERPHYKLLP